jgi:hypothetical protein
MAPLTHLGVTFALARRRGVHISDLLWTLAPDAANPLFILERTRVHEDDPRVRLGRMLHSPLVAFSLFMLTRGRAWPYLVHWICDAITHEPYAVLWPFVRRIEKEDQ